MSERNMEHRSLCSSCKYSGDCAFQKDRQKPILYCEEFEIDTSPLEKTTEDKKPPFLAALDPEDKDSEKFIGLCTNCNNRKTCVYPKPEGGIWHCEEYQ